MSPTSCFPLVFKPKLTRQPKVHARFNFSLINDVEKMKLHIFIIPCFELQRNLPKTRGKDAERLFYLSYANSVLSSIKAPYKELIDRFPCTKLFIHNSVILTLSNFY